MAQARDIPSKEDLLRLPRWARVAYAARCARRVQPLFQGRWPDAPDWYCTTVDESISNVERFASVAKSDLQIAQLTLAVLEDAVAASNEFASYHIGEANRWAAVWAAQTTADAVATVAANDKVQAEHAAAAGSHASDSLAATITDSASTSKPLWNDVHSLGSLAKLNQWTDDTPVPPTVFGPLWPDGPPPGWPSLDGDSFSIEVEVPDHVSDDEAFEWTRKLARLLFTTHTAGGGHGLGIVPPVEITSDAAAPVPVGGPT